MYLPSVQKLIKQFSKLPTVGPRTAARFVFYLISAKKEEVEELIKSILELKGKIKLCKFCFNPFEPSFAKASTFAPGASADKSEGKSGEDLCKICSNSNRDRTLLCLVGQESDLLSIEKTKKYKGLYFILGGTVSALKKTDIEKLRIKELEERIKNPEKFGVGNVSLKEIILALNPTTEGEATALYLEKQLQPFGKKITRLARGLPVGAELEYADEETLSSALEGRK